MEFSDILRQAVLDLEAARTSTSFPQGDFLPVLRHIIKECPRTPKLGDEAISPQLSESILQLSNQLCDLLVHGNGCVPQVAALALCCVLPATIGVPRTANILGEALTNKDGYSLVSSLLQNIRKSLNLCANNGECGSGSGQPAAEEKIYKEESIQRIYLVNATIQCPNSLQLMLQLKNDKPLLCCLFDEVEAACLSLVTRYHPSTMKALTSWLIIAKGAVKPPDDTPTTLCIADVIVPCLNRCIIILNCCIWDGKAFGILMDLSSATREHCSEDLKESCRFTSANTFLLCAMWEMPWRSKRKLQMLAELLPRFGAKKILSDYPDLPKGLVQSLPYNELQSACGDVYKAILKALNEEEFSKHFLAIHVSCLMDPSTIQGVANYWLPALVKKFPCLVREIEQQMQDHHILAKVILLQIQRREGLIPLEAYLLQQVVVGPDYYHLLCNGLTVYDIETRAKSFYALCSCFGNTIAAIAPEIMNTALKLAHGFIMDNLSITNQAARHSILRSASFLLPAVRDFLAFALRNISLELNLLETEETKPASSFLRWLFHFLVHNLEPGNNYQRHITALKLYQIVLTTFSIRGRTTKVPISKVIEALNICECWLFETPSGAKAILRCILSPTDDVRITAANILFSNEKLAAGLPPGDDMMAEGLLLCLSQQFSTVEGGAMLYNVGAHFSKQPRTQLFSDLLAETHRQFVILQKGLLKGALEDSPVHGVLQAILLLIQSEKESEELLALCNLTALLDLIEKVTGHLLTLLTSKSSTQEFAPSFEDMDWAIEAQIYQNYNVEEKSVQLSPHYQLALNCAWLNLKVSCELASYLGLLLSRKKENEELVKRCGNLLMLVLQKSRHKGAFEAAGVALGNFVHNTSANGSEVHIQLLQRLMSTLNLKGKDAPPLSRRSAGLAVAVHRIVTSDTDEHKVLLHEIVGQLISGLKEEEQSESSSTADQSFVDTLSARLMHVLFTLVSDSATRHHMARHLENITLAALRRLNSSNWGIRNAAMQLFGAVVTKLTAQRQSRKLEEGDLELEHKSDPEEEWDVVGSALLEDAQLCRPVLLSQIVETLETEANQLAQGSNIMKNYTSLVFHLGLVIRMTPGPQLLQTVEQKAAVKRILTSCWKLLKCPEWTVRIQAVACILVFTDIFHIPQLLSRAQQEMVKAPENKKHGCLLLISKTERKINLFLQLMPRELGLYNCNKNLLASNKAKIKPSGSYVCHQFIKFKDIKKGDFFRIIRELSKYPCSKHVAKMLWTANMVENVVLTNKNIPSPEILDKCFEADSLSYIQERVLLTMYSMISNNQLTDQMLEIQLILYETLDQVLIARSCNRHRLLNIVKVLVAIKRRTTEKYVLELMPEVFQLCAKESEACSKIKQWTVLCGETLWVQPLLSLLEKNIYGDEFELYSLELLGLLAMELMAGRYAEESMSILTSLSDLVQSNLQEDLPDHSSIGRLIATIAPVTWNLRQLSTHHEVPLGMIGYSIVQATGELLAEQNYDASRSVWSLTGKRNYEALNPIFCLRQMCRLGAEKLMSSKMLYTYLWQQLTIIPEELRESAIIDTDAVVSPFSTSNGGIDLETFDFIASDFKYLDYFRKHLMNMDPQMAAFMPETQIDLPGSTMQEFRMNTKVLVDCIATFRQQATGPLQWLPLELQVAIRKLTLQLWIHLEILQEQGIDLSLTDLDGTSANERVYRLRRHLNTRNQLDSPDFD